MCLMLDESLNTTQSESGGIGWKVLIKLSDGKYRNFYGHIAKEVYEVGKICIAKKYKIEGSYSELSYTSGFHIFKYKKDAVSLKKMFPDDIAGKVKVKKVVYFGVIATGLENDSKKQVIVSPKMLILEK